MKRSGVADLPLHSGRVPAWLAQRMTKLGTAITENIVHDYGTSAFLSRLSDPFWFQALGAVMGMDWHSSGITTSVMGALKRGLAPKADELGLYICGGRGRFSRNTPTELRLLGERRGFDGETLVRTSRLTARIDNNATRSRFRCGPTTSRSTSCGPRWRPRKSATANSSTAFVDSTSSCAPWKRNSTRGPILTP
jgi:hypothetical protein